MIASRWNDLHLVLGTSTQDDSRQGFLLKSEEFSTWGVNLGSVWRGWVVYYRFKL